MPCRYTLRPPLAKKGGVYPSVIEVTIQWGLGARTAGKMGVWVGNASGMRPGPLCPVIDSVWAPKAGLRTAAGPYHRMVHLDPTERFRVHDGCQSVSTMRHRAW